MSLYTILPSNSPSLQHYLKEDSCIYSLAFSTEAMSQTVTESHCYSMGLIRPHTVMAVTFQLSWKCLKGFKSKKKRCAGGVDLHSERENKGCIPLPSLLLCLINRFLTILFAFSVRMRGELFNLMTVLRLRWRHTTQTTKNQLVQTKQIHSQQPLSMYFILLQQRI